MSNDFTALKDEQASEKFYLLRLKGSRYLNDLATSVSGDLYSAPWPYVATPGFFENSAEFSEVSTLPSASATFWNDTTNQTIYWNSPNAPASSYSVIADFYLFYTGEKNRVVTEDPENTATPERDWEPKLLRSPEISQNMKNIFQGIISFSANSVSVVNDRFEWSARLTPNDSFYNREVTVWLCINDVTNIKKVYEGFIKQVSVKRTEVTFRIEDGLSLLRKQATMGDTDDAFYNLDNYPDLQLQRSGQAIPFIFGKASRYDLRTASGGNYPSSGFLNLDPEALLPAVCTDYDASLSTSNNREWTCARVTAPLEYSCSVVSVVNGSDHERLTVAASDYDNFLIGDTFAVTSTAGTSYHRLVQKDSGTDLLTTGGLVGGSNYGIVTDFVPSIVVTQGDSTYYLRSKTDYTSATASTQGGNTLLKVTLANNWEGTFGADTLDPQTHQVFYRVRPDSSTWNHADALEFMLEKSGISAASASFATAATALNTNVLFSVPQFDEGDILDYTRYAELICESTLGHIYLNDDLEVGYKLFFAPSATVELTETDILKGTFKVGIDYNDITHQLVAFNPHASSVEMTSSSETRKSAKAQYLHKVENTDRFRHVLEDISGRVDAHLSLRSQRFATYTLTDKIKTIDAQLGDNFRVVRSDVLGGTGEQDLVLIGKSVSPNKVDLTLTDLKDL